MYVISLKDFNKFQFVYILFIQTPSFNIYFTRIHARQTFYNHSKPVSLEMLFHQQNFLEYFANVTVTLCVFFSHLSSRHGSPEVPV